MSKTDAKRCYDIVDRNPNLADKINVIRRADPTKHLCTYMDWLVKAYKRGEFRLEDIDQVKEDMALYDKNKSRFTGRDKDINSFTYSSLKIFLDKTFKPSVSLTEAIREDKDKKVLYEGPLGTLVIPVTYKGSCDAGSGTRWCTASKHPEMFDYYSSKGTLYIWIDKKYVEKKELLGGSKKFQFHFEVGQFMDEYDNALEGVRLKYFRTDNPITSQLFAAYEDRILKERDPSKIIVHAGALKTIGWNEGLEILKYSPEYATKYAGTYMKQRWPEAEPYIAKDPYWMLVYSTEVAQDTSKYTQSADNELVKEIAKDPRAAGYYSLNIMKARWPEAESVIALSDDAAEYAKKYLTGKRWPEAEPTIAKSRNGVLSYIKYNLDMRWIEVEPLILNHEAYIAEGGNPGEWETNISETIIWYSRCILHHRWHEAEPLLTRKISYYLQHVVKGDDAVLSQRLLSSRHYKDIYHYSDVILKGRLPAASEAEFIEQLNGPKAFNYLNNIIDYANAYVRERVPVFERFVTRLITDRDYHERYYANIYTNYALNCIKGRWIITADNIGAEAAQTIEDIIMQNATSAVKYTIAFFKMRIPELEEKLIHANEYDDILAIIDYTKLVMRERWREAEVNIVKYAKTILMYCTDVLHSRWPDEGYIEGIPVYSRESVENFLLSQPDVAIKYAILLLPDRWPELEDIIAERSSIYAKSISSDHVLADAIVDYCVHHKFIRWPGVERYLLRDPKAGAKYAHLVLADRWFEYEQELLSIDVNKFHDGYSPFVEAVVYYSKNVIKGRWPEIEHTMKILTDLYSTALEEYERDVVKYNWLSL